MHFLVYTATEERNIMSVVLLRLLLLSVLRSPIVAILEFYYMQKHSTALQFIHYSFIIPETHFGTYFTADTAKAVPLLQQV